MILLTLLVLTLIVIGVITAVVISVGGGIFVIIFSDVIVCMLVIAWIIKSMLTKKKK